MSTWFDREEAEYKKGIDKYKKEIEKHGLWIFGGKTELGPEKVAYFQAVNISTMIAFGKIKICHNMLLMEVDEKYTDFKTLQTANPENAIISGLQNLLTIGLDSNKIFVGKLKPKLTEKELAVLEKTYEEVVAGWDDGPNPLDSMSMFD